MGSRSRSELGVFGSLAGAGAEAAWEKNRSRSLLEEKSGAGAAEKLAGSWVLLEDKKHKEIVLLLLFFKVK